MYLFEHPDFEDLINQTARTSAMPFAFVEKDYWVTYVLFKLNEQGVDDFIFKGGTSLTKGWGLLDRFSEDIDLLFVPHELTKERKKKHLKKIKTLVSTFKGLKFNAEKSDSAGHYRTDCYDYQRFEEYDLGPLLPQIKLEMGYRGGSKPFTGVEIQSYVGRELQKAGEANLAADILPFAVQILDTRRTFVEKLFAIHSAYLNSDVKQKSRHYYDVYKLLGREEISEFIGTADFDEFKKQVAKMSGDFFEKTHAPENLDFSKSPAFRADDALTKTLNEALKEQRALFFKEPPTGDEIIGRLQEWVGARAGARSKKS